MKHFLLTMTCIMSLLFLPGCATTKPRVHHELAIDANMQDARWVAAGFDPQYTAPMPVKITMRLCVDY